MPLACLTWATAGPWVGIAAIIAGVITVAYALVRADEVDQFNDGFDALVDGIRRVRRGR